MLGALLVLLGAVAARADGPAPAGAPDPCASAHAGGGQNFGFAVDGSQRAVHLHVPATGLPVGRPAALLIALHGFGGSGSGMEGYTGFSALADRQGFIAAYPDSRGPQWAIHDGTARGAEDIEFIKRLIDDTEERFCINPSRVFVAGVSNGGGEAARLACALSDKVLGVALVAGQYRNQPLCRPERAVSVFEIHAQTDEVARYRGGAGSVPYFLAMWRGLDHCSVPGTHRRLDAMTVAASWTCAGGSRVAQLRIRRGGHFWPGATLHGTVVPAPGSAANRIWDFFSSLR